MEDFKGMEVMLRSHAFEQIWSKVLLDHIDQADSTAYVFMEGFKNSEKVSLDRIIPVDVYEELKATDRLHRVVVVLPKKYKYNCNTHSWETEVPTELLKEIELEDPEKFDFIAQNHGDVRDIDGLIYAEYLKKYGYGGVRKYIHEIIHTANTRSDLLNEQVEFLDYHDTDEYDPTVCYETSWGTKVYAYIKRITNITLPVLSVLHDADKVITLDDVINHKTIILGDDDKWKELDILLTDIE